MANPICLSPLKFYDDPVKQNHRKSYAYGHVVPVLCKRYELTPFQFVLPSEVYWGSGQDRELVVVLIDAKNEERRIDISDRFHRVTDLNIVHDARIPREIFMYSGSSVIFNNIPEGLYYLEIEIRAFRQWARAFYSEVFCLSDNTDDCLEIEYWNTTGSFLIEGGGISFDNNFHFKLLLKTEVGKPEYEFEEEATKRLGYTFVESQVSKKIFKFNALVPEYICDAMRIIRLCDNKIIRSKGDEYKALTFEMEVDWEEQGDLASVDCSFETDNVIVNLGGRQAQERSSSNGSYSSYHFNDDYDNVDEDHPHMIYN